ISKRRRNAQFGRRAHMNGRSSNTAPLEGVDLLRFADAAKLMQAEARKRLRRRGGEAGGRNQVLPQFRGELLEPRRMIDGGTDPREVEPVPGADVAVGDIAQMQGQTELDLSLAAGLPLEIARVDRRHRCARCLERSAAGLGWGTLAVD